MFKEISTKWYSSEKSGILVSFCIFVVLRTYPLVNLHIYIITTIMFLATKETICLILTYWYINSQCVTNVNTCSLNLIISQENFDFQNDFVEAFRVNKRLQETPIIVTSFVHFYNTSLSTDEEDNESEMEYFRYAYAHGSLNFKIILFYIQAFDEFLSVTKLQLHRNSEKVILINVVSRKYNYYDLFRKLLRFFIFSIILSRNRQTSNVKTWRKYGDEWEICYIIDLTWIDMLWHVRVRSQKVIYFDPSIARYNKTFLPTRQHATFLSSGATDIRIWPVVPWQKLIYFYPSIETYNKKFLPKSQHVISNLL